MGAKEKSLVNRGGALASIGSRNAYGVLFKNESSWEKIENYLQRLQSRKHTYARYEVVLKRLFNYLCDAKISVEDIDATLVEKYLSLHGSNFYATRQEECERAKIVEANKRTRHQCNILRRPLIEQTEVHIKNEFQVLKVWWNLLKRKGILTNDSSTQDVDHSRIIIHITGSKSDFNVGLKKHKEEAEELLDEHKFFTAKEIGDMLTELNERASCAQRMGEWRYYVRWQHICTLLYFCALRVSEACNARFGDIKVSRGQHYLRIKGKGGRRRNVPLSKAVLLSFENYLRSLSEPISLEEAKLRNLPLLGTRSDWTAAMTRNTVARGFAQLQAKLGMSVNEHRSPHAMRHSRATSLASKQLNSIQLAEFLGHADTKTTKIYYHTDSSVLTANEEI